MDLFEVITRRRSIRRYKATPVEKEKLLAVLEAARLAPTWENKQGWRLLVITAPEQKERLLAAIPEANPGKKGIASAPVAVVLCAHPGYSGEREGQKYYLVDCGIALEHLVLAACAQGLGTCWIGVFDEDRIKKDFGIPEPWRVVALTPLGYPDQDPPPRPRKPLREMVFAGSWGGEIDLLNGEEGTE
ncbi:MAG: nitroreductase family protein [Bacillota bacterium]